MYLQKKKYVRPENDISSLELDGILAQSPQLGGIENVNFEDWNNL